jgi:exosortase/archaeosortase family protein
MSVMQQQLISAEARGADGRSAIVKIGILLALAVLAIRSEMFAAAAVVVADTERAHGLAVPFLIGLLIYLRREKLQAALAPGSLFGFVFIMAGLALYAFASWPFNYGYPRQLAIVPLAAGCILSVAGWRVLKLCVPMLLLMAIAVPLGSRHFAFLVIRPETVTLEIAERLLTLLPGLAVTLDGPDLHFDGVRTGVIALGDPNRGATLLLASVAIGMFVSFVQIRPLWQLCIAAVLAGPIILVCNLLRLLVHAAVTIYGEFAPVSAVPRTVSHVAGLLLAYAGFVALFAILKRIIVTPPTVAAVQPATREVP